MIRLPPGAVILDAAEVDYIAGALESFVQLLAERRDEHGDPAPRPPTPRLLALTAGLRTADSLAVPETAADHGQRAEPPAGTASVRAPQHHSVDAGPHVIGTGAAARYIGITANAVRDAARRGRLPARRTGTRWVFDAEAVAAYARRKAARRAG